MKKTVQAFCLVSLAMLAACSSTQHEAGTDTRSAAPPVVGHAAKPEPVGSAGTGFYFACDLNHGLSSGICEEYGTLDDAKAAKEKHLKKYPDHDRAAEATGGRCPF